MFPIPMVSDGVTMVFLWFPHSNGCVVQQLPGHGILCRYRPWSWLGIIRRAGCHLYRRRRGRSVATSGSFEEYIYMYNFMIVGVWFYIWLFMIIVFSVIIIIYVYMILYWIVYVWFYAWLSMIILDYIRLYMVVSDCIWLHLLIYDYMIVFDCIWLDLIVTV